MIAAGARDVVRERAREFVPPREPVEKKARHDADSAVLARCFKTYADGGIETGYQVYEAHRKPRTSRIQAISSANTWLKSGEPDTSWLYGYDAWNVPLQ